MTERQDKFIDIYSKTGNATQSAIEAGYSEKTAKQKGYELKNLLRKEINEQTQKVLADHVPSSIKWLSELAETSDVFLDAGVSREGGPLELAPRASVAAQVVVLAALSAELQVARNLSREEYARRHPAGELGQRARGK